MSGLKQWTSLLFAAGLLACGCETSQQRQVDASSGDPVDVTPTMHLVARSRPPVQDLPVPLGFRLDEAHSRSFDAGDARYVHHMYHGDEDKFAVQRFYKRQMPINRWTLVTDMFVQGDIMLDFEKDLERCRIVITDGGLFDKSTIKAMCWTSGRIPTPPEIKDK